MSTTTPTGVDHLTGNRARTVGALAELYLLPTDDATAAAIINAAEVITYALLSVADEIAALNAGIADGSA